MERTADLFRENSDETENRSSFASTSSSESHIDKIRALSDLFPLITSQSCDVQDLGCDSNVPLGESSDYSASKRLEELKKWLWLKQEVSSDLEMSGCLYVKWLHRGLKPLRRFLRKTSVNKFFRDTKERRKEKLILQGAHIRAALNVAGVAAAIAAVATSTAASATNEREAKTGLAVASAAALVAAQCADIVESLGAD
eukprot:c15486_g1_i1 orf=2-592(-)